METPGKPAESTLTDPQGPRQRSSTKQRQGRSCRLRERRLHKFGRTTALVLAAMLIAPLCHALEVGLKGIIGYGVPLTSSFIAAGQNTTVSCTSCPLNDDGIVAFDLAAVGGTTYGLFDGKAGLLSNGSLGPGSRSSGPLEINNSNTLTYPRSVPASGIPYTQLYSRTSPSGTVTPMSQANFGPIYWLDVNNNGLGVVMRLGGSAGNTFQVVRLRGDGSEDLLAIDPTYLAFNTKPRVVDSGDIYVNVLNRSTNSHEIWRFASGVIADHTVAFSIPGSQGSLNSWDVNEAGELVIGTNDTSGVSSLLRVSALGVPSAVPGSSFVGTNAQYGFIGINSAGWIAAYRAKGGGTATDPTVRELLYARPGGALEVATVKGIPLAYGSVLNGLSADADSLTINGFPIVDLSPVSRMNEYGQITLNLAVSVPGPVPQYQIVRVDPQGSIGNPIMPDAPDVCLIAPGWWCLGDSPNSTVNKQLRALYFDPVLAQGYEYIAISNAFTSVRIPFAYGDGRFALHVWNDASGQYVNSGREVVAGEVFRFDLIGYPNGLARFALLGIEAAAGIDSADPRGFVTGLTFASGSTGVRFVMKPVVGALDSDGDGVADSSDACPGTPANAVVNAQGCSAAQLDTDGDGVSDATDACPNTAPGAAVDARGCSAAQRDSDGDGVNDSIDQCPNTPTGAAVNSVGCATSQLDSDRDGVNDSLDQCPSTPAGMAVNSVGCAASQLDSDGDGVSDALDACPGTAAGTPVDARGCPIQTPTVKRCDVNGDKVIDYRDIGLILLATGKPAATAVDPRDANGNGRIELVDAAICTKQCNRALCLRP